MKSLRSLLRRVLRIPAPRVDAAGAIQIARAEAARQNAMMGRVVVREGPHKWAIWLNADFKGGAVVEVDKQTARVERWMVLSR